MAPASVATSEVERTRGVCYGTDYRDVAYLAGGDAVLRSRVCSWDVILTLSSACLLAACQPRVAVEPPAEPITINLNIKLDAEVRVKLEEQAEQDIQAYPEIF